MSLIEPLDQGPRGSLFHYTMDSMERIVNTIEENLDKENIMKARKDHTIEDATNVVEEAMKAIKSETINFCWRKKVGNEGFQDRNLGEM